jgi:hypothetical protein
MITKILAQFSFSFFVLIILFTNIPSGFLLGLDWTFPITEIQLMNFIKLKTWNALENFGGESVTSLSQLYYKYFVYLIYKLGVPLFLIQKTIIIFFFLIGQLSFVILLLKIVKNNNLRSVIYANIFSLLFIFSISSYENLISGWIIILISYLLCPIFLIFLIKSTTVNKNTNIVISGFIIAIALSAVQFYLFYFLIIIPFIFIYGKKFLLNSVKAYLVGIFLNIHLLIPLISSENFNNIVFGEKSFNLSTETTGLNLYLNFSKVISFQVSTYNEHFKLNFINNTFPGFLSYFGLLYYFVIYSNIFLFIYCFFITKCKKFKNFFYYIFFFIFFILVLSFFKNEYSNFSITAPFRHIGRILPFLHFLLIIFVAVTLLKNFNNYNGYIVKPFIGIALSILLVWNYDLSYDSLEKSGNKNLKLKKFEPHEDYNLFYKKLVDDRNNDSYGLFFPYGSLVFFNDRQYFSSTYNGIVDVYTSFAPINGKISVGVGRSSLANDFIKNNFIDNQHVRFSKFILHDLTTYDFFIFRKNVVSNLIFTKEDFINMFENNRLFKKYFESENLIVYEKKNKISIFQTTNYPENNENKSSNYPLQNQSYKKINDSIYLLNIANPENKKLIFHQQHDQNWCLIPIRNKLIEKYEREKTVEVIFYFFKALIKNTCIVNNYESNFNYSTSWNLNFSDNRFDSSNVNFILFFLPQLYLYLSFFFYFLFFILISSFLLNKFIKNLNQK